MIHSLRGYFLPAVLVFASFAACAHGQLCHPQWLTGFGPGGLGSTSPTGNGAVYAAYELPNGDVLVGGAFSIAGTGLARGVARFERQSQTWFPVGTGLAGTIYSIVQLPDGDLLAGGRFSHVDGSYLGGLARWNGSSWRAFEGGGIDTFNEQISSLLVRPDGRIVAHGTFDNIGGVPASNIAEWDGVKWRALGAELSSGIGIPGSVYAAAILPDGNLLVGGRFSKAGNVEVNNLALWDGANWTAFPVGPSNQSTNPVMSILLLPDGDLIFSGDFTTFGGVRASKIVRYDGTSCIPLGLGLSGDASNLVLLNDGSLLATGDFESADQRPCAGIARWDGTRWNSVGTGVGEGFIFTALPLNQGDLFLGGSFTIAGGRAAAAAAIVSDNTYIPTAPTGLNGPVNAIARLPNGDTVLGGEFTSAGGKTTNRIVRWDGSAFHSMGAGMSTSVNALVVLPSGELIAGGAFGAAGGKPASHVAKWNGLKWEPLGAGLNATVNSLAVLPDGTLVAGGDFTASGDSPALCVASWNGIKWTQVGQGFQLGASNPTSVETLHVNSDGRLFAAGSFTKSGTASITNIARWSGTQWEPLGAGLFNGSNSSRVYAMTSMANGDLIAAGFFATAGSINANNIARWDGSNWSPMPGTLPLNPLVVKQIDGTLYAGGRTGYTRYTGAAWEIVSYEETRAIQAMTNGDIWIGGDVRTVGDEREVSFYFARFASSLAPTFAPPPQDTAPIRGSRAVIAASSTLGLPEALELQFQWMRNGTPVLNGNEGAVPGGGTVSRASGTVRQSQPLDLIIENVQSADAGMYQLVLTNACDQSVSESARLRVRGDAADLDADGVVADSDFSLFVVQYDIVLCASPDMPDACSADFNRDGGVDDRDFMTFVVAYVEMNP